MLNKRWVYILAFLFFLRLPYPFFQPIPIQSRLLTTLGKTTLENIVGKGENAGNQHFLLFPQCFLPFPKQISTFQSHVFCRMQVVSIWPGLKNCRLVKS